MKVSIRKAISTDLPALTEIDQTAADMFIAYGYDGISAEDLAPGPTENFIPPMDEQRLWVAVTPDDEIAGYLEVSTVDGTFHVAEVSVHSGFGRQGIGAKLLHHACDLARADGFSQVTLTTFSDVPWNQPFYERHGFRVVAPESVGPEILAIFDRHAKYMDMERRVAMVKSDL